MVSQIQLYQSLCWLTTNYLSKWKNTRHPSSSPLTLLMLMLFSGTAQGLNSSHISVPVVNMTDENNTTTTMAFISATPIQNELLGPAKSWDLNCKNMSCTVLYSSSPTNIKNGLDWIELIFLEYKTHGTNYLTVENLEAFMKSIGSFQLRTIGESEYDSHHDHDAHEGHHHDDDYNDYKPETDDANDSSGEYFYYGVDSMCLQSVNDILDEFYPGIVHQQVKITLSDFGFILPRLFYHIFVSGCVETGSTPKQGEEHSHEEAEVDNESSAKVWGIALVSVAVISLLSVIGIMIVPLMGHSGYFQRLLSFLVALAVGTLVGDALLHLLPHALGGHEEGHAHSGEAGAEEKDKIVKSLVAVLGIYMFFVFESAMAMIRKRRRKLRHRASIDSTAEPKTTAASLTKSGDELLMMTPVSTEPLLNTRNSLSSLNRSDDGIVKSSDSGISSSNAGFKLSSHSSSSSLKPLGNDNGAEQLPLSSMERNHDDADVELRISGSIAKESRNHGGHQHHHGDIANAQGIKDLAWMILAGDGLHNFSDGLAIGAAFTSSISAGLSTSLAIFCHELPHELGDFAILIDAGMSIKRALLYNGLCACLAFIGAVLGLLIGEYTTSVKLWILAMTAGGFLYVALADMLPQMLKQCVEKNGLSRFFYQNLGFLLGVVIMLLIAWYEEAFLMVFNVPHGH